MARKKGAQVKLYSRPGNDLTYRFPLIVETLARLRSRSCIIDGEAVACDDNGVTLFNRVRYRRHDESIFLYAFDLIELNGDDLRRDPLEGRKATLEMILAKAGPGIRFNEHMDGDGETVFRHACKLGLEGIVSKRKDYLPFRPLARLAQDEERRSTGSEARRPALKAAEDCSEPPRRFATSFAAVGDCRFYEYTPAQRVRWSAFCRCISATDFQIFAFGKDFKRFRCG